MAEKKFKNTKGKGGQKELKFQDLPFIERMVVRVLDHFQGYDTYDPKGNLKKIPKHLLTITDKQREEWNKIDPSSLRDFDRNPIKYLMNSELFQQKHNKGGLIKKKKKMNVGGLTSSAMQNGLSRKINPSTGLTMNKGGMTDYRKSGMFYGGGMARRGK